MTAKQRLFADEYLIDLNATKAAIRAGYSEKTAYSAGQRMLKNVEIFEHIQERLEEKEAELIAAQNEVLRRLTKILRREEMETIVVATKKSQNRYESEDGAVQIIQVPAKLCDVIKAAELLGKYYTLWTEKTKIEEFQPVIVIDDIPEKAE